MTVLSASKGTYNQQFTRCTDRYSCSCSSLLINVFLRDGDGDVLFCLPTDQHVLTDGKDEEHLSRGVYDTYTNTSLRFEINQYV